MTIYEVRAERNRLEAKREVYQEGYERAAERARTYYNERVLTAEADPSIADEEMNAICDTYDELYDMVTELETKVEIAERAIEALSEVETTLAIAKKEGIWKEG